MDEDAEEMEEEMGDMDPAMAYGDEEMDDIYGME